VSDYLFADSGKIYICLCIRKSCRERLPVLCISVQVQTTHTLGKVVNNVVQSFVSIV
jgi:hypothetical protein